MFRISYQKDRPTLTEGVYDPSLAATLEKLRKQRETECYSVINRGRLWYNRLTTEQYAELELWYQAWLDVTDTLKIPKKPEWINNKLETEEIY